MTEEQEELVDHLIDGIMFLFMVALVLSVSYGCIMIGVNIHGY
jgi:hypothetical protein